MSLTFDEASHTYRWDGQPIPGVTQVLAPLTDFSAVPLDILAAASAFGVAIHKATELDDEGALDEAVLDDALRPYLAAWRKFVHEHEASWSHIECRLFHPTLRYAGTADRIGLVDGELTVVDIKTTAKLYPAVGPQLAAYRRAAVDGLKLPVMQRASVRLMADGNYDFHVHTGAEDLSVFVSLLTVRNWCRRHNIRPHFQQEFA